MEKVEYICDDSPKPISDRVKNMTPEEIEAEYHRLFGGNSQNNRNE